jgi:glycine cleavage system aminomethyltransferase T
MWARQLGERSGVSIPLQAAEHYYLLTEPIPQVSRSWPVLEDPASHGYFREEGGGLMLGLFEPVCAPWKVEGIPADFSFGELPPNWERMGPYLETAMARIPVSRDVGIRKFFCGPESFTPDLQPVVGEAPELRNYFVAAGLNSVGILTGGGLGRAVAHWILNGKPDLDVTGMNIDRLHRYQANPDYRRARTVESLGSVYLCHYPTKSMQTARGIKHSAVHSRLVAERACFKDVSGWEGADWFAPEGVEPVVERLSWGRQNWFPYWEAEHRAAREGVVLMDMSFMSKFAVQGRDAGRLLDRLSANNVNDAAGRITYTQWLNDAGLIEADLTVTKRGDEDFFVVASDSAHRHVETWLRRHIGAHDNAFVTDVTSGYAQLNIQGPRSRELMALITHEGMSDEAFPFRTARDIDCGFARALCIRITYLGELGYELYVPTEQALYVYDRIVEAGRSVGLVHAGLKALSSLRMEKGYRDYGHDIDNTDCVLEAGLGFAVDLRRTTQFIGRQAVEAKKAAGPLTRRLVQILVKDPEPLLFHAEVVRRNGVPVGYLRAASYGFTLGGAVGLAMIEAGEPLDQAYLDDATWEVEVASKMYPATASIRPLYDPTMSRVRS